jgi:hypothetical protein
MVPRIPPPTQIDASARSPRLQPTVDHFTYQVIAKLVGIKGRDEQDVTYYILRDWIRANREELESLGITVEVRGGHIIVNHESSA